MRRRSISLVLLLVCGPAVGGSLTESVHFRDGTGPAGLAFLHVSGSKEKTYILESMSGGVAVFDYDSDGWMDIYLVNGSTMEDLVRDRRRVRNALFRNNRDGTFRDVTEAAGVSGGKWDMGAVAGDIDNDGDPDLFVTGFGANTLYRNNGDGTFRDVTSESGLGDGLWSTGAALADYDRDGWLDLAVVRYVMFHPLKPPERTPLCTYRGLEVQCGPRGLPGTEDSLFRNLGKGKFEDVSSNVGIRRHRYYGLGCLWTDYDNDGDPDLFVANDSWPNFLFRNDGGRFTEIAMESGVALNEDGNEQAGMGVDAADLDSSGFFELVQTNFSDDKNTLYRNEGGFFSDASYEWNIGEVSWQYLGWAAIFLDANLDGYMDLFISNGHVYPQVDNYQIGTSFRQRDFFFLNQSGRKFQEVGQESGITALRSSRGAAVGDLNNDGRPDLVINHLDEAPILYWNETPMQGKHWIGLDLHLASGGAAVGARVTVHLADRALTREVRAGSSYLSQNDHRLLFGLGQQTPQKIEIRWPSGATRVVSEWKLDAYNRMDQE